VLSDLRFRFDFFVQSWFCLCAPDLVSNFLVRRRFYSASCSVDSAARIRLSPVRSLPQVFRCRVFVLPYRSCLQFCRRWNSLRARPASSPLPPPASDSQSSFHWIWHPERRPAVPLLGPRFLRSLSLGAGPESFSLLAEGAARLCLSPAADPFAGFRFARMLRSFSVAAEAVFLSC
jgi:hypothetical protein